MQKNIKVSILVPIYNAADFLPECLDTLTNQTLQSIEIICINDGSTDNSADIISKYAKQDSRIKVVTKKNTGYGDSMNIGLQHAKGDYVGIVEPDDFVELNMFETLYNIAVTNDVDVVKSNFYEYYGTTKTDKGKSDLFLSEETNKIINPREHRHIFYQPPCIWAAIYRRDFLSRNKINFLPTPGASYQDTGFNFKVWASTTKAYFINDAFLHYRQDNSNSSVKSPGKIYCVKEEYDSIEQYLKDNDLFDELAPIVFTCRFGGYIWNLRRLTFRAAMQFSDTVTKDYKRAQEHGYILVDKLDSVGKYNVRMLAIRHPKIYIFVRPLHGMRNRVTKFLSKAAKTISPVYRTRIQTMDALARLELKQSQLSTKIQNLEKQKGKTICQSK